MKKGMKGALKALLVAPIAVGMAFFGVPVASAATATDSFDVTATVNATCTITAPAGLNFGVYSPTGGDLDAQADITINCTNGAFVTVTLDQGVNPTGTSSDASPDRQMSSGSGLMGYGLFTDNGRTANWNNTTGQPASGTGADQTLTVFGRIPGGQSVMSGSYVDTIVATVNY